MKRRDHILSVLKALTIVIFIGMACLPSLSLSANQVHQNGPSVVSLDYCSDQFVLLLADRKQIIALSKTSEDIFSFYRARAKNILKTQSTIEEVLMLKPDIAIQTYSGAAHMGAMTKRSGISLIAPHYGSDPDTVYKNIELVGNALNQQARAKEFNKQYENRLKALKRATKNNFKIAYITPSGITAGVGASIDDIIKLSGFESYAAAHNLQGWQSLPLELLIIDPPDMFITGYFEKGAVTQSRWSLSRHDQIFEMMQNIPTIDLPSSFISCNGLFHVDAAERIRKKAIEIGVLPNMKWMENE